MLRLDSLSLVRKSRCVGLAAVALTFFLSSPALADEKSPISASDTVTLGATAFSGVSGIVRINQAAGVGNLQSNVAVLRLGSVSDARLDALTTQSFDPASKIVDLRAHGRIVVSSSALTGVRGLIQLNQSAGNGNASSNSFLLTVTK